MHIWITFIHRAMWTIGLLIWGIVHCHAYDFRSTSNYRTPSVDYRQNTAFTAPAGRVAGLPSSPTATYQGDYIGSQEGKSMSDKINIFAPFSNEIPSDKNNPANNGGTSNDDDDEDDEEVIPGTPSDPVPPTEYPIGEPWIMLLFAAVATAVVYAKNKTLTPKKH